MSAAFLRVDFIDDISYPLSLALKQVGVLAPVFIYFFVGELVGDNPAVGGDYFTFATLGLSISTMLQAALNSFGGRLQRAQNRGTFETLLVEPISWNFLPFAMVQWRIIIGVFSGTLVFLFGLVLGMEIKLSGIPGFLLLVFLGVLASMAVGVAAASLMVLAKRSQPVLGLYGLVASVLAGALFSVDQLPPFLQTLSLAIPHTYVINGARALLMEDPGTFVVPFKTAVIALTVFNIVVFSVGLWLFHRALQYARKMGLLSGY